MFLGALRNALEPGFKPLVTSIQQSATHTSEQRQTVTQIGERLAALLAQTPRPKS